MHSRHLRKGFFWRRRHLKHNNPDASQALALTKQQNPLSPQPSLTAGNALFGKIVGIVLSLVVCPVDHVKTRMQTASVVTAAVGLSPLSLLRVVGDILGSHGIVVLYRGLIMTVARQCPRLATYFGLYDTARSVLLPSLWRRRRKYDGNVDGVGGRWDELLASLVASNLAGALSWAIVYPLNLIKTRV